MGAPFIGGGCYPDPSEFERFWAQAVGELGGPVPTEEQVRARVELWRVQEWHDWFRWRLCRKGFDWSKPLWFGVLSAGLLGFILAGLYSGRWEISAGGVVGWFTLVNLGFFAYLGLHTRLPPPPVPGPFLPGPPLRARMGLYPAGYNGRRLARLCLKVRASEYAVGEGAPEVWYFELALAGGAEASYKDLLRRQALFRLQRGDAPAMAAVCEVLPEVSRREIDSGMHPLRVVAWRWDEASLATFQGTASGRV